ncbi:MAG TPA: quercetin 2,3-dioxygenase [Thermomicrobiales bacterium]|nr:quercetin 2,3-dioxygenase [Thermomicrobiales bacterium]
MSDPGTRRASDGGAPYARDREEGPAIWFLGTLMTFKATAAETGGAFGLIEQVLPPGFAPPPHVHHAEDEAFYLLEGEGIFFCGDRTWRARPGTFVYFPRGIVHGFRIEGATPARLLQLTAPAGLEQMFVEAGEPAPALTLPPAGPPRVEKLLALAPKYRFAFAGPEES